MSREGVYVKLGSSEAEQRLKDLLTPHFVVKTSAGGGILVLEKEAPAASPYDRLTLFIRQLNGISPNSIVPETWKDLPLLVALRKAKELQSLVPLHTDRDLMFSALRFMQSRGDCERLIHQVSDYAGQETALYFRFISSYRNWLVAPAVLSVLMVFFPHKFPHAIDLAPVALAWASAFLSFGWQPLRRQAKDRPRGASLQLLGYHEDERRFSRLLRAIWSFFIFSLFAAISVWLLFLTLNSEHVISLATVRIVLFTFVSQSLGALVDPVARKLTSWEHHADDFGYEKSRITKAVILKLALFFPFPIHLAFTADNAVSTIQSHLATTFTTKQIVQSVSEMLPWIWERFNARNGVKHEAWEGPVWTTNDEYLEMGIQFATLMAFGFLWPLSFFLAFVNNFFEGILDAEKFSLCRRPFPSNTDLNKLWLRTFRVLTMVGASVNVALLLKLGERTRQSVLTQAVAGLVLAVLAVRGFRDLTKLMRGRKSKHD